MYSFCQWFLNSESQNFLILREGRKSVIEGYLFTQWQHVRVDKNLWV